MILERASAREPQFWLCCHQCGHRAVHLKDTRCPLYHGQWLHTTASCSNSRDPALGPCSSLLLGTASHGSLPAPLMLGPRLAMYGLEAAGLAMTVITRAAIKQLPLPSGFLGLAHHSGGVRSLGSGAGVASQFPYLSTTGSRASDFHFFICPRQQQYLFLKAMVEDLTSVEFMYIKMPGKWCPVCKKHSRPLPPLLLG